MADPRYPASGSDTGDKTRARPPTPLWVKVFGVIIIVLVLLVVILLVFGGGPGGGGHGPRRHIPSSGVGAPAEADEAALTFVVTNTGQAVHEFTLGDAAVQQP